ncbi:uncharacterized protein LOC141907526 isoform X2 [Tubulanus polymorphus]|uniref:uncharacterized protein LOC141907526 isoform X2 n=1 Tax=Tubulanus polymorphus TaxID=672921 RepID=UPI003DA61B31
MKSFDGNSMHLDIRFRRANQENNRYEKKMSTDVKICNPITHSTWENGKFTTYEIVIETSNIAFSLSKSSVRRRYSEFVWLRHHLSHSHAVMAPSLPKKTFFSTRFNKSVITERMTGLKMFIDKVVTEVSYLSDSVVHLFLQSSLSVENIEKCIKGEFQLDPVSIIMAEGKSKGFIEMHSPTADIEHCRLHAGSSYSDEEDEEDRADGEAYPALVTVMRGQPSGNRIPRDSCGESMENSLSISTDNVDSNSVDRNGISRTSSKSSDTGSVNSDCSAVAAAAQKRRVTFSQEVTVAEIIESLMKTDSTLNQD